MPSQHRNSSRSLSHHSAHFLYGQMVTLPYLYDFLDEREKHRSVKGGYRIDEEEEEDRYILQNFRESLACCIDALVYWENMQQFSNLKTEQEQEELLNLYQKMQERLNLLEERLPDLTPVLVENIRKKKELIDQNVQKNVQLYGLLLQKITENKQKVQSQTKPKTPDL